MNEALLRKMIKEILSERIRSDSFKMSEFIGIHTKGINSLKYLNTYADKHLEYLSEGSARAVYALSAKKVLKIAWTRSKGVAQNKAEVDFATTPFIKGIITKIYDFDPNFTWIIAELVRPLDDVKEFEKLTGFGFYDFIDNLEFFEDINLKDVESNHPSMLNYVRSPIFQQTLNLLKMGLKSGDLETVTHWGKTVDGRVVILDYGFTEATSVFYKGS